MKRTVLVLLAVIFLTAILYVPVRLPTWTSEDDIREAVFRYQFRHNYSGLQSDAKAYYLAIRDGWASPSGSSGDWRDPAPWFMKRFGGNRPVVRSVSECTADPGRGVRDKRTDERGLVFVVGRITFISETEAEVEGGYYEGGVSASGIRYRVVKRNDRWVVTGDKLVWIS